MAWFWFWFAFTTANAAAFAFYFALRQNRWWRTVAWLVCSGVIVGSPCCIPLNAPALRFLSGVSALALLFKVYDAYRTPAAALARGAGRWVAYLPNWFWFVLERTPRKQPAGRDWRRVVVGLPLTAATLALCVLLRVDWSRVPFVLEHVVKVTAFALAITLLGGTSAALYRRLVGPATDPIDRVFTARTPAEFWRRWNRPFRDFFDKYVFRPCGGSSRPVTATLAVFAASGLVHEYVFGVATGYLQGWQMLFFMLQGCAAAATLQIRPKGRATPLWQAGTMAFNFATAVLFCRSVNGVIAFYRR